MTTYCHRALKVPRTDRKQELSANAVAFVSFKKELRKWEWFRTHASLKARDLKDLIVERSKAIRNIKGVGKISISKV